MLLDACKQGDVFKVQTLINQINIYIIDEEGSTPIIIAAKHGQLDIVKILANLDYCCITVNSDGDTAFSIALRYSHPQIAEWLLNSSPERIQTQVIIHDQVTWNSLLYRKNASNIAFFLSQRVSIPGWKPEIYTSQSKMVKAMLTITKYWQHILQGKSYSGVIRNNILDIGQVIDQVRISSPDQQGFLFNRIIQDILIQKPADILFDGRVPQPNTICFVGLYHMINYIINPRPLFEESKIPLTLAR